MANEEINPEAFRAAWKACRSYPGMGDLRLSWSPYTGSWLAMISFCDKTIVSYNHCDPDVNAALRGVADSVHENPPPGGM